VSDANLVLGRLLPEAFLGGRMALDAAAARRAVGGLGRRLGLGVEETAAGIVQVANEHMARALRVISVQRGIDPRDMALASFGGAGGLHVCALAEALGMGRALVPVHGGVLSALGMIVAPPGRRLARTLTGLLEDLDAAEVEAALAGLAAEARAALAAEGVAEQDLRLAPALALRYRGQAYTLEVPWEGRPEAAAQAFHARHEARYGHRLAAPVELVAVRLGAMGPAPAVRLERAAAARPGAPRRAGDMPVWDRQSLAPDQEIPGPALVTEAVATTWVAPGWRARADAWGNLSLRR
jgi:N-methylhydantoinase A